MTQATNIYEHVWCKHCHGTGCMIRDPDIGTDQECFVCDGIGILEIEQVLSDNNILDIFSEDEAPFYKGCNGVCNGYPDETDVSFEIIWAARKLLEKYKEGLANKGLL